MKLVSTSLFLFLVLLFNSCKNDLKLNAPYKEIPSIYAVINPQERIQMIRINKVFLGERDANEMAQVADSINYPAGELTVTLNRYVNGNHVNAIPGKMTLTFRDSMIQASPGSFNTSQRVYVCSDNLHQGAVGSSNYVVNGDYVLTVKNNKTGNIFTAKATAIDSIGSPGSPLLYPFKPLYYPNPTAPVNSDNFIDFSNQTTNYSIRYVPTPSGKVYQIMLRFYYGDLAGNIDYIDYNFANQYSKDIITTGAAQGQLVASFRGLDLFNAAGVALSKKNVNTSIARKMIKMQVFAYSTSQDYLDYMQYIAPSLSVSQSKPLYSNFDNQAALGLFTFRSRCVVTKEMASPFVSEFAYNKNTCFYNFLTATGGQPGCN